MPEAKSKGARLTICTIGHSTRTIDEFVALLKSKQVSIVVDVRTVPRSRHNPQYGDTRLRRSLSKTGIKYLHLPELGGLRKPKEHSVNTGWRNRSFQGYADHMQTPEFSAGLATLLEVAHSERPVLMCAEAVPWRCHRNLIADALAARGVQVEHLMTNGRSYLHRLTAWARITADGRVIYPAPQPPQRKKAA